MPIGMIMIVVQPVILALSGVMRVISQWWYLMVVDSETIPIKPVPVLVVNLEMGVVVLILYVMVA